MKSLRTLTYTAAAALGLCLCACTEDSPKTIWPDGEGKETPVFERGSFAKGADVSWVTELENAGYTFRNQDGTTKELMELLRDDCGVNAIRLRVFVNPERDSEINGWCSIDDVVVKARRAHALGLRIMIDFHFSDTWADPGKQGIPSAWEGMTLEETLEAMDGHVNAMMTSLKHFGIEPEWVQIGNETRTGMMWPLGSYDNDTNFSRMVTAGSRAVKAVFPDAAVIVHVDCGNQYDLYTRLFGKLNAEGAEYDMIGMSLYPDEASWQKDVDDCLANIPKAQKEFGKPVMLCEIGFDYARPDIAEQIVSQFVEKGAAAGLKGVFWWEPEAPADRGYTKGCFDRNGAPTAALNPFVSSL